MWSFLESCGLCEVAKATSGEYGKLLLTKPHLIKKHIYKMAVAKNIELVPYKVLKLKLCVNCLFLN